MFITESTTEGFRVGRGVSVCRAQPKRIAQHRAIEQSQREQYEYILKGSYTGEIPKIAEMTEFELRLAHKHRKKK